MQGRDILGPNFRLDVEALVYTCNLTQVRVLAVDPELLPLAEALVAAGAQTIRAFVLLDGNELRQTPLEPLYHHEDSLEQAPAELRPVLPALCGF